MNHSIRFEKAFKEAICIILFAALAGLIFNTLSSKAIPLMVEPRLLKHAADSLLNESVDSLEISEEGFKEPHVITLEQAYKLYISKKALFIDARKSQFYETGHIKGAINIPWHGPEEKATIPENLSTNQLIITYCEGIECDSSVELAYFLFDTGFYRVQIFYTGLEEWLNANYPIE